jgi:hypothetical protein
MGRMLEARVIDRRASVAFHRVNLEERCGWVYQVKFWRVILPEG